MAKRSTARTPRTPKKVEDWAPTFLAAFAQTGMVTAAAERASIGRRTAYDRREGDAQFARAWDEIVEHSTESMEREAYRRAVEGVEKPVHYQGERVDLVREYSDTLLIFMLKARRPTVYRERVEHTGAGGGPIEHRAKLDLSRLSDEQLAALEAIQPHAAGADED